METPKKEQEAPSKENVLLWMKEQIEFKKVQLELQELDTKIATSREAYMKSMHMIAQLSSPIGESASNSREHTLTEEDLKSNPELVTEGFKAGDVIKIPTNYTVPKEPSSVNLQNETPTIFSESGIGPLEDTKPQ